MYFSRLRTIQTVITTGVIVCLLVTACSTPLSNATPEKVVIGIISLTSRLDPVLLGFKAGMAELGYVEGKNVAYIYHGAVEDVNKLDSAAQDLVKAKVDLILSLGTLASRSAQKATSGTTIPVVFAPVTDPVLAGLVTTIRKPDGNITGITSSGRAFSWQLEWLLKIVPKVKRIFVPYYPDLDTTAALGAVQVASSKLGVEVITSEVRDQAELTTALNTIPDDIDAIFLVQDVFVISHIADVVKVGLARKLPIAAPETEQVGAGALLSFGLNDATLGKQASRLTDRILKGNKPSDLPVEVGDFFLGLNLKTAQALGIRLSDDVLRQARTIVR